MSVNLSGTKVMGWILAITSGLLTTSGCVFKETYEAEKSRALNFQRLLAQEEKRSAELDSELKRIKRDATDYEARNRELTAQVQSAREQMARVQEETDALRESIALQQKAQEQMKRAAVPMPTPAPIPSGSTPSLLSGGIKRKGTEKAVDAPAKAETLPKLDLKLPDTQPAGETPFATKPEVLAKSDSLLASSAKSDTAIHQGTRKAIRHEVKPGDTVYRLSRRYGVTVEKIREWNNRQDDLLEVGQKIIVGYE